MKDTSNNTKQSPSKDEIRGRLIFSPIMIIGGLLIFLFASLPKLKDAGETKKWSECTGNITSTYIVAHRDGHVLPLGADRPEHYRGDEDVKFRVVTKYVYTVNNIEYESLKRFFMQSKHDGYKKYSRAERWRNYYLNHNDPEVYYNPQDPNESLLRKGLRPGEWLLLVSPSLMVVIGILLLFSMIKTVLTKKNV